MEFFGLTIFGPSDPIKFLMRPDFKEPTDSPNMTKVLEKGEYTHSFAETIRDLDIYSSYMDGYSYKSNTRLNTLRKKGYFKPIRPSAMYRDKIIESTQYGWWADDPELKGKTWYEPYCFIPMVWSEETRYLNTALLMDSAFQL